MAERRAPTWSFIRDQSLEGRVRGAESGRTILDELGLSLTECTCPGHSLLGTDGEAVKTTLSH